VSENKTKEAATIIWDHVQGWQGPPARGSSAPRELAAAPT